MEQAGKSKESFESAFFQQALDFNATSLYKWPYSGSQSAAGEEHGNEPSGSIKCGEFFD
jgi:hypothetical protein